MRRATFRENFAFLRFFRTLARASGINAVLLGLVWLAQYLTPETIWPLAFLVFMPQQLLLLPPLALLLIAASRKQTRICLANGVVLMAVVFLFLDFNLPSFNASRAEAAPGKTLRVLSYNIRYGSGGVKAIAAIIKAEKPDVICLQEVLTKDTWPDPLPFLRKQFPEYAVSRYGELVTLSRFPILQSRRISLPLHNGAGFLETQISLSGKKLRVYNVHFINPIDGKILEWPQQIQTRAGIRQSQLSVLAELVRKQATPYIIAGDFNTPTRGRVNRGLMQLGLDTYPAGATGFGYTFPAVFPLVRIDRIFCSRELRTLRSRVLPTRASDHRPLITDLVVQ